MPAKLHKFLIQRENPLLQELHFIFLDSEIVYWFLAS